MGPNISYLVHPFGPLLIFETYRIFFFVGGVKPKAHLHLHFRFYVPIYFNSIVPFHVCQCLLKCFLFASRANIFKQKWFASSFLHTAFRAITLLNYFCGNSKKSIIEQFYIYPDSLNWYIEFSITFDKRSFYQKLRF